MALKPRTKKTSLAFMGEGWDDAYIESRMLTNDDQAILDEINKNKTLSLTQQGAAVIKQFFVSGKGVGESGELIDMVVEDIDTLDIFTLGELASQVGMPDPKASATSTPTTAGEDLSLDDLPNSSTANDSA